MPTGLRWERSAQGQIFIRRERSTGETVAVEAPVFWKEDFIRGSASVALTSGWPATASGGAASGALKDQSSGPTTDGQGVLLITSDTANTGTESIVHASFSGTSERLVLGTGTTSKFNRFEARVKVKKNTAMNYQNLFIGLLGGDIPAAGTGIKTLNTLIGFIVGDASGTNHRPGNVDSLLVQTVLADGASSPAHTLTSTGTSLTDDTYAIFRVEVNADKSVSFYVNNVQVNAIPAHTIASITAANSVVNPVVLHTRTTLAATANQCTVEVDYGMWWGIR